jgi:hypothetical protein
MILLAVWISQTVFTRAEAPAALNIAQAPDGAPLSKQYQVRLRPAGTVAWQIAPVYSFFQQRDYNWALTTESQFVTFDATGKIEVEVTVAGQAKTPVIRPLSRKIAVKQDGATLRFTMGDTARQLCLELNSDPRHPLVLFSNPPETDTPKSDDPLVAYFGPGYHKAGTIKSSGSGKTIYLAPGAVVEGSLAISEGDGVTVRGRGILFNPYPKEGKGHRTPLNIYASRNVRIEGIVLLNRADSWTFRSVASRDVTIENFHLLSEIRDGLDIINSQAVRVCDSFFMAHDDAICLKGLAGEGRNQPVEDVHVEHCVLANMAGGNGIEIGYESVTPVYQRLTFQNIDVIYSLPNGEVPDPQWPEAALSIHPTQMHEYGSPDYMGTMPPVRDVTYRDIRMESCQDDFFFDIRPNRNSPGVGIQNIFLENVSVVDSPLRPSRVVGLTNHPVRNVTFKNLNLLGQPITNAQQGRFVVESADCRFIGVQNATPQASSAKRTTVHPHEIDDPLVNPYCGWGIWAGPRFYDSRPFNVEYNTKGFGDDASLFSWVLIDWMWADLETKEGQFDWKDLDTVVDYWKACNKQFVIRLWVTTDPGWAGAPGNKACPDWLWDVGVKYHEYKAEGGVKQRCPAYADPTWETLYLPKMKRFLAAYRDRYHKPGGPVVLDYVMGFGDWGEWHTMWSHYPWPSREKKREVLGKAIDAYLDVFAPNRAENEPVRNLAIAHVYDDDCGGDLPLADAMHRQALDIAAARGFAFARNGFIDGLGGWPNDLMNKYWPDHQLIGEGDWSYEQMKKDKTHGSMAEHVDTFAKFHSTYAHLYMHAASYKQAMAEDRGEHERALKAGGIGYRFVLTSASWETSRRPGETLTLRQEWVNRNASWCVYPYRLKLYLLNQDKVVVWSGVDKAFDPRSWLKGNNYSVESAFLLPENLQSGNYDLRVALVDTAEKPQLRLGINGDDGLLRYPLGNVEVGRHSQ